MNTTLREITQANVREICRLRVKPEQEPYVAPNGQSLAEAQFADHAWTRAVYVDEQPAGFVLLSIDPAHAKPAATQQPPGTQARITSADKAPPSDSSPTHWRTCLWRFMIDAQWQGKGIGRRSLELVIEHVRSLPKVHTFYTSYVAGDDSPKGFYQSLGFQHTGETVGDEQVMKLDLQPPYDDPTAQPVLIDHPSSDEVEFIDKRLTEFNKRQAGRHDFKPVHLIIREAKGDVIGGLKGVTGWDWLYVEILWVHEQHRGQGLGSKLLEAAEQEGRSRHCRGACLSTFTFQAPEFYRKRGYEQFGEIEEYPPGSSMMFFSKEL